MFFYKYFRKILKETGLHKIVPVSHMNEHGSHFVKLIQVEDELKKLVVLLSLIMFFIDLITFF